MSSSHKGATTKNSSKSKQAAAAAALPNDFIDVDAEGDVEEEDQLMMNQPTSSSAAATLGYGTKRVKRDYQVCACSNLTSKNLKIDKMVVLVKIYRSHYRTPYFLLYRHSRI
jgi:hypothetical protein